MEFLMVSTMCPMWVSRAGRAGPADAPAEPTDILDSFVGAKGCAGEPRAPNKLHAEPKKIPTPFLMH